MPTLLEIKCNIINSIIAFLGTKELQKAYLRSLRDPEFTGSGFQQLKLDLRSREKRKSAEDFAVRCRRKNIELIGIEEDLYPKKLKEIDSPPLILFVKGSKENLKNLDSSLAIVGSRTADIFGCEKSQEFGKYAAQRNICVVSGLALGVDTFAHKGALESSLPLPTIAVLGNGLDRIFPSANEKLADNIIEGGGLLISHFAPGTKIYGWNFLDRNRIISGLSDAILVIQAPKRSGALNTAMHALDENRDLLIMPGAVNDPLYAGSNALMKRGAGIICEASDILDYFPGAKEIVETETELKVRFTHEQSLVMEYFKTKAELHIDELQEIFKDNAKLAMILLDLELAGVIKQGPGNYLRLTAM